MTAKRKLAHLGQPKIRGYLASRANKALFLYRRRNLETWMIGCDFANKSLTKKIGPKSGKTLKFKVGSQFIGRFYPNRCNLSPNGERFVYFVMRGQDHDTYQEQYYCWTAMCSPPNIKAEFLLPHEDTWGGGGMFLDDHNLLVFNGMYHDQSRIRALDGQMFGQLKVHVSDSQEEILNTTANIKPVDNGWRGTDDWQMLSGRWYKKCKKAKLIVRYRDNWQEHGEFGCFAYSLVDWKRKPLLPASLTDTFQWADFDSLNRLWVTKNRYIEIYNRPGPGMSENPDKIIDLEKILNNKIS